MVKKETVPISNKNPVPKVRTRLKMLLSASPKFHTKKLSLTAEEIDRNSNTKTFNKAKRFGNNLDHMLSEYMVKCRHGI